VTDYAIVARIHDSITGQPVIIVAGILDKGTEAASEVLYNPVYLDALLSKAPRAGTASTSKRDRNPPHRRPPRPACSPRRGDVVGRTAFEKPVERFRSRAA